jgi:ribosomal protein L13
MKMGKTVQIIRAMRIQITHSKDNPKLPSRHTSLQKRNPASD